MRYLRSAILTALACMDIVLADNCVSGSQEIDGNWYCQPVEEIVYSNVGSAGSYNRVTNMAPDGVCSSIAQSYSGPLSPFDEEVSVHFRGPLALKQFASYTLSASVSASRRRDVTETQVRRRGHSRRQRRRAMADIDAQSQAEEKRDEVVATIDGQVVSWENDYFGPATTTTTAQSLETGEAGTAPVVTSVAASTTLASSTETSVPDGAYTRTGYYNAELQSLQGLTFLGNHGGYASGVFDTTYGLSLSYLDSTGTNGAATSQILSDTTIASDIEFAIMSDTPCHADDCGYVRPGSVAYHGFSGADKLFLLEFSMPSDSTADFNADMPAIWLLNAQIPRTVQYGSADCSCWATGCGEMDIMETLSSGSAYCKSTIHTNAAGGDSDYFVRPTQGTMKLAVLFQSAMSQARIVVLANETVFDEVLSAGTVTGFGEAWSGSEVSTFAIAA